MTILEIILRVLVEGSPVVLGLLVGWLVERFFVRRLQAWASHSEATWDDALIASLRHTPIFWGGLGGLWIWMNQTTLVLTDDQSQLDWWGRVLIALWIGSITLVLMRFAGGLVQEASRRQAGSFPGTTIVDSLAKIIIGIFGGFLILQNLDIDITPLITALGIGGLAVALALQDTLGNLFAGIQIILSRQVRPYDYVHLESGEEGYVADVKSRNTTIRTFPDGNLVIVPNSRLAGSVVKNFTLPQKALWVDVPVGVHYSSDLEHVERVTLEVANETLEAVEGGLNTQAPVVVFQRFGDSSIDLIARMFVREFVDQFRVRHTFIKKLHARYREEGIVIPFPIRTLDLPDDVRIVSVDPTPRPGSAGNEGPGGSP
jgi:small-conductance mechanosensitive channel